MQDSVTPPIATSPFGRTAPEASVTGPGATETLGAQQPPTREAVAPAASKAARKAPTRAAPKPLKDEPISRLHRQRRTLEKHLTDLASTAREMEKHGPTLMQDRPPADAVEIMGKRLKGFVQAATRATELLPVVTEIGRRSKDDEITDVQRQVAELVRTNPEILPELKALVAKRLAQTGSNAA